MSTKMSRAAYEQIIAEDLAWLLAQPSTLERNHIAEIVKLSPSREYDGRPAPDAAALREALGLVVTAWYTGQEMGNTVERVRALLRSEPRGENKKEEL